MRLTLLSLCTLIFLACGGTVSDPSTGTSTGAGGSSSTSTTTTSTSAGGSTSTSTSTSGTGGATSTSTGTGGAAPCMGAIDLSADNGAQVHYTSICDGSFGAGETSTALGYEFSGGPAPGIQALDVLGCVNTMPKSEGVFFSLREALAPGVYTKGSVTWTDSGGSSWGVDGDPFSVEITALGPVGGKIDGKFTAMVTHGGNAAHSLAGTFSVCRVGDLLAP